MSENKNHFILNHIYPEIDGILNRTAKSLEQIYEDALFVLDTNSLLAPFQTGKDDIEKIKSVYEDLIKDKRLFIPKHVLKEFAKNRSTKISELYSHIDKYLSETPTIKAFEYPILGEFESYKKLNEARANILTHLKDYKESLKELKKGVTNWNWSDPVTVMYSNTFNSDSIVDSVLNEENLLELYNNRLLHDIPPGNKDKSKDKNAIGDFVIWQTILELGKSKKQDIIFISNDEKNDWLLKGNKQSISTKFELVEEFWRETEGHNFICMTFENFVQLQGLQIDLKNEFEELFFDKIETKDSLDYLETVYKLLLTHLNNKDDDEETKSIDEGIYHSINGFRDTYRDEFFGTDLWSNYHSYLVLFDDWLSKIKSYNGEIVYQEHRMKRNTDTEELLLNTLIESFIKKYEEFKMII